MGKITHTRRGLKQDQKRRSKQSWERGRGAPKKGNPRYKRGRSASGMIVYRLRKRR